ncbi:hypothetical protein L7F22_024470 [Adiantum nelumboides]|nr:hypothetical protein [Adiantum nelumboides]
MESQRRIVSVLVLLLVAGAYADDEQKGRVLELTDATLDAAIAKHDYILFAEIASSLHLLTQKVVPFSWGVTEVAAFQTLKDKMTTGPVLILPDLQKSFEVYCDACDRSLGAVLMQEDRVIAYESRMFSKPEMTAQIYENELLAVIHALTQWRHYLLGADFTVFTDHQSLRYFLSQKQFSEKQMRWANILSQFHFQIVYVQGHKNVVADALSRKPLV